MLLHLVAEQLGVCRRVQRQKGFTEAGRKRRLRLRDTTLSAGDLGGVAGEEVVHRLFLGQLGDWRQNTEGIAGQENNIFGVSTLEARIMIVDMLNRVGDPGILSLSIAVKVDHAVVICNHVLEQRVALDGLVDLRFIFCAQIDGLGVAAAFEVKNSVVIPTVLIITDQFAMGVGGKRGLPGSRKTEEEGHITTFADVGRAMHGKDPLHRQPVVHHGEDTLFHFAAVPGAADDGNVLFDVENNEHLGVEAMLLPVLVG